MLFAPEIRTPSDMERGRPLDTWPVAPQRRDGSKELPPDACTRGHMAPRFLWGWEPGYGRTFHCTVDGCGSRQVRY
jgi:hypothetical protein